MNLKDEVIKVLEKAMIEGEYQNPGFVETIVTALDEVYGYESKELDEWVSDLWDR